MQLACDHVFLIYSGFILQATTELLKMFAPYSLNVTESQTERSLGTVPTGFCHISRHFTLIIWQKHGSCFDRLVIHR